MFIYVLIALMTLFLSVTAARAQSGESGDGKLRVLVVTGGHGFDRESFFELFRANKEIVFEEAAHPNAHARLTPNGAAKYDVVVLYDMWQPITDEAKAGFLSLFKQGKGLVALHHSLCGYNDWPEYAKVIGGRYRMKKEVINGVERPGSVYKHDVNFRIRVADSRHPITRGLKDFDVFDETYGDFDVDPKAHPLLTTDEPTSGKTVAWAHRYGKSRVAYIQLGHGPTAFADPNYRKVVAQAIRWAAGTDRAAAVQRFPMVAEGVSHSTGRR
jgi:uncharacterized protein